MNKNFVPYKHALKLKQLGFNKGCFAMYYKIDNVSPCLVTCLDEIKTDKVYYPEVHAPLYQQLFRWFQEVYKIHFSQIWYDDGITPARWTYHANKLYIGSDIDVAIDKVFEMIDNKDVNND